MQNLILFLCLIFIFASCKEKAKETTITSEFINSKISFDFFCNYGKSTNLMYYEKNLIQEDYLPVLTCDDKYGNFRILVQNATLDNGVWLTLSELSCINDVCLIKEKSSDHLMGEPDGELKFQVINKDVIKLVSSNVRQIGYQDSEEGIPYKKAKDFLDVNRNIYFFRRRPELDYCPMSRIIVDTVGDKGVSCSEEIPEASDIPTDLEKVESP